MEQEQNQNQNQQEQSTLSAVGAFVFDLVKILIIALIIIVPLRMFVAEPFVVSGSSMLPNFHNRDYLIVDRISYRNTEVKRGDVVVMKYPKDTTQYFIKRVIGLPGESISFQNGKVFITNTEHPTSFELSETYLPERIETFGKPVPVTLGTDEYYVLGDNRTASSDSRVWGVLPKDDIVGKVWLRVFPVDRFGKPAEVQYK